MPVLLDPRWCAIDQRIWTYIAKLSLSQRSFQVYGVTVSPYHWWESSWVRVAAPYGGFRTPGPIVTMVWVSTEERVGATRTPTRSNG